MNMANIVVTVLIILLVVLICMPLIKRMISQEDCCGNQQIKVSKKRLKKPVGKYTLIVDGMYCKNCVKKVTEAINDIDGLAAKVSLARMEVVISYEKVPMKEEVIKRLGELNFIAYVKLKKDKYIHT